MPTTLSLAAAQSPETGGGSPEAQARFNSGNSLVLSGTEVAVGGYAGISMVGMGAVRVNVAAEILHPATMGITVAGVGIGPALFHGCQGLPDHLMDQILPARP